MYGGKVQLNRFIENIFKNLYFAHFRFNKQRELLILTFDQQAIPLQLFTNKTEAD